MVALLGGYLIAATFVHTVPFAKAKAHSVAAASPLHSLRPAVKPTQPAHAGPDGPRAGGRGGAPHPAAARGHRRSRDAVPEPIPPPYAWDMTGRVASLICSDPGLPKGTEVHAYQLDSQAHLRGHLGRASTR